MSVDLALPKSKKVADPNRPADYISPRGVKYWWAPNWVRSTNTSSFGRIKAIAVKNEMPELHMLSKDGNLSYIRGRIQQAFREWHEDNEIDCILLGIEPEEIILTDWEYI